MTSATRTQTGHILVVDDNQVNRKLLTQNLQQQGHTVETAEDGEKALQRLHDGAFDLVLLDLEMPKKDGFQTLIEMKQDAGLRHIPVIMITAVDELESTVRCIEMGAEDYLPKPFNPVLLRARINASLEKKYLRDQEQKYLKGLEREFEIARDIQMGFLPNELPEVQGWEIGVYFKAAREVAGDFYDVFLLPDGDVGLIIADVCDKGVGAALFMTLFRSLLRAASTTDYFAIPGPSGANPTHARLKHAISLTNDYIAETHGDTGMFATVFFGILNAGTGMLTFINGGHEPPLIVNQDDVKAMLKKTGPAIGALPGFDFRIGEIQLDPGDLFFGYTDGVTDSKNAGGDFFERNRLMDLLKLHQSNVTMLLNKIEADLHQHVGDKHQFDDITLLAVKRTA
jgi:serine phosphatase RsbU (regulator of sigma subunit)